MIRSGIILLGLGLQIWLGLSTTRADEDEFQTFKLSDLSIQLPASWKQMKDNKNYFRAVTRVSLLGSFRENVSIKRIRLAKWRSPKNINANQVENLESTFQLVDTGSVSGPYGDIPWYSIKKKTSQILP